VADQREAPRGLYAIGTAGLAIEALVLLLAIPAVASSERGHVSAGHIGYLVLLVLLLIAAAGLLRRRGGKVVSSVVQGMVVAAGTISWPMYVVGAAFLWIWIYWLRQFHLEPEAPSESG
jgi:hypothetical protein